MGRHRWPGSLEFQAYPFNSTTVIAFIDIWSKLAPSNFLTPRDQAACRCISHHFQYGPAYSTVTLTRPWNPLRRRKWGFGIPSVGRSTTTIDLTIQHVFHFVWTYLTPTERYIMSQSIRPLEFYVKLRYVANHQPIHHLQVQQRRPQPSKNINLKLATQFACVLLRFNFIYGDFIRWLSGEYTNRNRNWESTFKKFQSRLTRAPPIDQPPADFGRAFRIFTEGVPLQGNFDSTFEELRARNRYDNHPAVSQNQAEVEAKFAKEEAQSFHIAFPRVLLYFITGLFISPLQWAIRKDKGRICVDCTNGPQPCGSPNQFITKPKDNEPDICPPVYYATAFDRLLHYMWRLRITNPQADILLHPDDINSAFRRILYHPDMAIIFAYVFQQYLIIPVGQVFGSRSAPSFFSLTSDIRAFLATTQSLHTTASDMEALATDAIIPPLPLDWNPRRQLVSAIPDQLNPPLSANEEQLFFNATFVDDNAVVATRSKIRQALHQSLRSAHEIYGFPTEDRRISCISQDKWDPLVTHVMIFLGFLIDSRAMTVEWPLEKRTELAHQITTVLTTKRYITSPKILASIIGKLRSAAIVAVWGVYITFSLQHSLTRALRQASTRATWFWKRGKVRLPKSTIHDLQQVVLYLLAESYHHIWTRPIALMVPRIATAAFYSDASYGGLGGWSPTMTVQWRILYPDLIQAGFSMKLISTANEPITTDIENAGLHINPLEFIAIIINLWLALVILQTEPTLATGHIIDLFSDNTSALSWLKEAATTPDPQLRRLTRLASSLLVAAASLTTRFQSKHIPGKENIEADILSRLKNGSPPSWTSVTQQCSRLQTCRLCLLPFELLSTLAATVSSIKIEESIEQITTRLLALEPKILDVGLMPETYISTIYPS